MKISTRVKVAAVCASIGVVATLGVAAPAQAVPWNCPVSGTGLSRSTLCYQGSGAYRIAIHCVNNITLGSTSRFVYGPWMSMSYARPSVGWCEWYERVGAAFPQTR